MVRPLTLVLAIGNVSTRSEVTDLCARARDLLKRSGADVLVCDVSRIRRPDARTLDALARLQLVALRLGRQLRLRRACCHLQGLLTLTGLDEVLLVERAATERDGAADRTAGTASRCRGTRSSR